MAVDKVMAMIVSCSVSMQMMQMTVTILFNTMTKSQVRAMYLISRLP